MEYKEGRIRAIGVSNFDYNRLINSYKVSCVKDDVAKWLEEMGMK